MLEKTERFQRASARWAVGYALKTGTLVKGPCEFVERNECNGPIEAHHDDHSRALEVRWVCRKHHRPLDGHMMARGKQTPKSQPNRNAAGETATTPLGMTAATHPIQP